MHVSQYGICQGDRLKFEGSNPSGFDPNFLSSKCHLKVFTNMVLARKYQKKIVQIAKTSFVEIELSCGQASRAPAECRVTH